MKWRVSKIYNLMIWSMMILIN